MDKTVFSQLGVLMVGGIVAGGIVAIITNAIITNAIGRPIPNDVLVKCMVVCFGISIFGGILYLVGDWLERRDRERQALARQEWQAYQQRQSAEAHQQALGQRLRADEDHRLRMAEAARQEHQTRLRIEADKALLGGAIRKAMDLIVQQAVIKRRALLAERQVLAEGIDKLKDAISLRKGKDEGTP